MLCVFNIMLLYDCCASLLKGPFHKPTNVEEKGNDERILVGDIQRRTMADGWILASFWQQSYHLSLLFIFGADQNIKHGEYLIC